MKRTYKLLGYVLLGIGVYAILNANNANLQANSAVTEQQTTYKRSFRHGNELESDRLAENLQKLLL